MFVVVESVDLLCHTSAISRPHKISRLYILQWASYQIRKIAGCACAGMPGMFSPTLRVSDPDMHHGTCVMHVPWCMSGSLSDGFLWSRWGGENVPGTPGACATRNFTYLVRGPWDMSPGSHCCGHYPGIMPCNVSYYKTASFQKEAMRTQVALYFFYEVKFV